MASESLLELVPDSTNYSIKTPVDYQSFRKEKVL